MIEKFLEQLSKDFGSTEILAPNEEGAYSFRLASDLTVSCKEISDACIILHSVLAPLPDNNLAEFLLYAMSANLFGRETGGSYLGIDGSAKRITLSQFISLKATYSEFHELLEDFANYADAWKRETIEYAKKHKREQS